MMILWWSRRGAWGIDLRGYLGDRDSWRVFGRWNVVDVRILRDFLELIYISFSSAFKPDFGSEEKVSTYTRSLDDSLGRSASLVAGLGLGTC